MWSDELYEFALYRIKASGLDKHANLMKDAGIFFGNYYQYKQLLFAENLTYATSAKEAMTDWRDSEGHYRNLLKSDHVIGAIACYNNQWIALFMDENNSILKEWKDHKIQKVVVKRYDSATGKYIIGSKIRYYETADRWNTQKLEIIDNETGVELYLEVGKEYAIYESATPEGIEVAEKVKVVVGDDTRDVVLRN